MIPLHERLRRLRHTTGMTLAQVAAQAAITLSFLSDIERGRALPAVDTLERICDVYGLTIGEALVDVRIIPLD